MVKYIHLPLLLAEALPCYLDHIQTKFMEQCKDLKLDAFLQLIVLLSQIKHIVRIHYAPGYLRWIIKARSYNSCGNKFNSLRQLIYYKRSIHKAAEGNRQELKVYKFVGEAANAQQTTLEPANRVEGRRFNKQYSISGDGHLQYNLEYYRDIDSWLPLFSLTYNGSV
ncbi:hypothetical protein BJY00DRAFT_302822 [Aspergillus carlsbadensis]|nr:hypothetical protein BJY00DRAFT_302822 [Aspergillus carlsbadensis]